MMLQGAQVQARERDAALHNPEVAAGCLEGVGELVLGSDVDFVVLEMEVMEGGFLLGGHEVEDGDVDAGGEEGFHGGGADVARATGDDDVGAFEAEPEVQFVHDGEVAHVMLFRGQGGVCDVSDARP